MSDIELELNRWADIGRPVDIWVRADLGRHAGQAESAARLRSLAASAGLPIAAAIVPQYLEGEPLPALEGAVSITVLQLGYANANHEPDGETRSEYGPHRDLDEALSELSSGREALERRFGEAFLPILVPPFEFIDPVIAASLRGVGLTGLSLALQSRPLPVAGPGVVWSNVHVSLSRVWEHGGQANFQANALDLIHDQLVSRRLEVVDEAEPLGLWLDDLGADEQCEAVAELISVLGRHASVRWLTAAEVFDPDRLKLSEIERWAFSQF